MQPRTRKLRPIALVGALAALALAAAAPNAMGGARAHAASSYITGIGDEQTTMFSNPLYLQLHTTVARYIAPYDAVTRPASMAKARAWISDAEADHQQVLVAFYHSEYTPTTMPSVATYQKDVAAFVKDFPHVREYQSWDEANRGNSSMSLPAPRRAPPRSTTRLCCGSAGAAQ